MRAVRPSLRPFEKWTARYPHTPAGPEEQPDYTINEPLEPLVLAERLNARLLE
ncbi:hypothetical protein [Paenibacillus fonticola]|uniref:hypothetical protein n=1 Tax=Paenibacillus fonticola TaxID=379896 RepID=UPI00037D41A0|nr:hypothetical protein [Paenibacillus fonticola]